MNAISFTAQVLLGAFDSRYGAPKCHQVELGPEDEHLGPSKASLMRDRLALGPATDVVLARHAKLASAALVALLLKHDLSIGRVDRCGNVYKINPRFDEALVLRAKKLLEDRGYDVYLVPRL